MAVKRYNGASWVTEAGGVPNAFLKTSAASTGEASTININVKPWNMPWGKVGYSSSTLAPSVSSATLVTMNVNVAFTATSGRLYKATLNVGQIYSSVNTDQYRIELAATGAANNMNFYGGVSSGSGVSFSGSYIFSTSTSSVTVTAQIARPSGTGTVTTYAPASAPTTLIVEDLGPV